MFALLDRAEGNGEVHVVRHHNIPGVNASFSRGLKLNPDRFLSTVIP
jgi:hypothetical protein